MRVEFTNTINNLDGSPMQNGDREFTVGQAIVGAVVASIPDDNKMDIGMKIQLHDLALMAQTQLRADISSEVVSVLKERINKIYTIPVVAQLVKELEG